MKDKLRRKKDSTLIEWRAVRECLNTNEILEGQKVEPIYNIFIVVEGKEVNEKNYKQCMIKILLENYRLRGRAKLYG